MRDHAVERQRELRSDPHEHQHPLVDARVPDATEDVDADDVEELEAEVKRALDVGVPLPGAAPAVRGALGVEVGRVRVAGSSEEDAEASRGDEGESDDGSSGR